MGELDILNQPFGNLWACPLGRYVLAGLSEPVRDVHLWKEAVVFGGPLILVMPVSGLCIALDPLEDDATTP